MYRPPNAQMAYLPVMFGGFLVGMFVAVLIYSKGYEGRAASAKACDSAR